MTKPQFLIMSDFDGVIADTERLYFKNLLATLKEHTGFDKGEREFCAALSGYALKEGRAVLESMMNSAQKERLSEIWQDHILPIADQDAIETVAGMKDLYRTIAASPSIRLATVSNSRNTRLNKKVDTLGLRPIFGDAVHSFEDSPTQRAKPDPAPYLYAAALHGFSVPGKHNAIVIEDSVPGARAGVACGAYTIGFVDISGRDEDTIEERRQALLAGAGVDEVCAGAQELRAALERRLGLKLHTAPQATNNNNPAPDSSVA